MIQVPVAVASRTFSRHPILRAEMAQKFSNIRFNDEGRSLQGADLIGFLDGQVGAILALERLDSACIEALTSLKVVAKYGVGLDGIDTDALKRTGKTLSWTGGVNRRSVAELTLCFMIGLLRNVLVSSRQMSRREWINMGGTDLSGKTIGIIGCGHIGSELLKLLSPFSCRLLVHDIRDVSGVCQAHGATVVSAEQVLRESDVVTIHIPYNKENHHFIGGHQMSQMKSSAILINTSRGGIVDEAALFSALTSGQLAGAAMDVFTTEPAIDSPLLDLQNFVGTPHIGGSSKEAILAMGRAAIDGLAASIEDVLKKSEDSAR